MTKEEQINKLLDADFTKYQLVVNRIYKEEYVKRLEHNWNELKRWLEERYLRVDSETDFEIALHMTLDKMQSLEEGGNNENNTTC